MPTEQSIAKALHVLTGHATWMGDNVINTNRLDKDGELKKEHKCFNGLTVADVLILDDETVFKFTEEAKIIVGMVASWLELRHSGAAQCNGFVQCDDIQNVIESTLFQLEKAFIEDAAPQVIRSEEEAADEAVIKALDEALDTQEK